MKKIFDVGAYESETPVKFVNRVFDNEKDYLDYINSPNNELFVMTEREEPENVKEAILNTAKGIGLWTFFVGSCALAMDFCNGFQGCEAVSKMFKKRKAKKFLKKFIKENPEITLEELKGSEVTNLFNEDEIEKIFNKVRGA